MNSTIINQTNFELEDSEEELECSICLNDLEISNDTISCNTCKNHFCKSCICKNLLTSIELPHCPSCKIKWNYEVLENANLKGFLNKEYKNHRKKILFDHEISKLQSTMPACEKHVKIKNLTKLKRDLIQTIKDKQLEVKIKATKQFIEWFCEPPILTQEEYENLPDNIKYLFWFERKNKLYYSKIGYPKWDDSEFIKGLKHRHKDREYGVNNRLFDETFSNHYYLKVFKADCQSYLKKTISLKKAIKQFKEESLQLVEKSYEDFWKQFYKLYLKMYFNTNYLYNYIYTDAKYYYRRQFEYYQKIVRYSMWNHKEFGDLYKLKRKYNYELNNIRYDGNKKEKKDAKLFVQRCGDETCRGFLSKNWICGVCNQKTCKRCLEVLPKLETKNCDKNCDKKCFIHNKKHVCDEEKVKSVELIKKETVKCPNCAMAIYRISGCPQMWCTNCNNAFDWKTGRKINGKIHNPHYFEWKAKEGNNTLRQPNEIVCGGLPNFDVYNSYVINRIKHPTIKQILYDTYRLVNHIQDIELTKLRFKCNRQGLDNNEDLRIRYLLKDITDKNLKRTLLSRDKANNKSLAFLHLFEMFNTIFIETINDLYAFGTESNMKSSDELINKSTFSIDRFIKIKNYVNSEFKKLGKRLKNKVPFISEKWEIHKRLY